MLVSKGVEALALRRCKVTTALQSDYLQGESIVSIMEMRAQKE